MTDFYLNNHEIALEAQQYGAAYQINDRGIDIRNIEVSRYIDVLHRHTIVKLMHRVYCGKPQKETHEVKYPATWFDAFKLEYPRLCRWFSPAKYVTVKVYWEGRITFPELNTNVDQLYKHVVIWDSPKVEKL